MKEKEIFELIYINGIGHSTKIDLVITKSLDYLLNVCRI